MTDIPKEAFDRADDILFADEGGPIRHRFARLIADVSEKAKKARAAHIAGASFYHRLPTDCALELGRVQDDLGTLILPDPESDLLKEAREIAKIGGYEEDEGVVQIILVALKRKDG